MKPKPNPKQTKQTKPKPKSKQKPKQSLGREVLKNSFFNSSAMLISKIGGLAFTIIIARLLHPELFGVYALTFSIILLLIAITDLGLNRTLSRYVSEALGKKEKARARSYFKYLIKARILIALTVAIILFVFSKPLALSLFKKQALIIPLRAAALYLFFASFLNLITRIFYVIKKVKFYVLSETIKQITRLIAVPLIIIYLATAYKVFGVFLGLTLATFFSLGVSIYYIRKNFPYLFKGKLIGINKKRLFKFASYIAIGGIAGPFFVYIDSILLGIFLPEAKFIGFYRAVLTIVTSLVVLISITEVMFPIFTQLKHTHFKEVFKKVFHFSAVLSFPIAFGLAFIIGPFIKIIYGAEYLPEEYRSAILLTAGILSFLVIGLSTGSFFRISLVAKEKPQFPLKVTIAAAIINFILSYLLIIKFAAIKPELGMVGAAVAVITTRFFSVITLGIIANRELKISPTAASIYKPVIASIIMVVFLIAFNEIVGLVFPLAIFEIIFAATVYFTTMILIKGITKQDILYFRDLISPKH